MLSLVTVLPFACTELFATAGITQESWDRLQGSQLMQSLAYGDLHWLMLVNTAAWAQRLHQKRKGRSAVVSSLLLSSSRGSSMSRSSGSKGSGCAQLSRSSSVLDHHTQLIELVGLKGVDCAAQKISEDDLSTGCFAQVFATAKVCMAAAAAATSSSFSAGSSSVSDLVLQMHPQLQLVILEMLALAPKPGVMSTGMEALK